MVTTYYVCDGQVNPSSCAEDERAEIAAAFEMLPTSPSETRRFANVHQLGCVLQEL